MVKRQIQRDCPAKDPGNCPAKYPGDCPAKMPMYNIYILNRVIRYR